MSIKHWKPDSRLLQPKSTNVIKVILILFQLQTSGKYIVITNCGIFRNHLCALLSNKVWKHVQCIDSSNLLQIGLPRFIRRSPRDLVALSFNTCNYTRYPIFGQSSRDRCLVEQFIAKKIDIHENLLGLFFEHRQFYW